MTTINIQINGVILSPDGIDELRGLQEGRNFGIEAHLEGLQEVTSFLLTVADELEPARQTDLLKACKSINYVRSSIATLRAPIEKEVHHG